ncbi:DUF1376 domain-containing protein [Rhizobium rhizoryzae]|uniref:DUF1376 domain-containing protein n=1 Tax=Rhizobium rhizoryzae TaxID=451876 RepID=UPI0028A1E7DD|nr:DUF1376 domain-containing protein [Rhizobium rhizoryzae]
MQVDLDVRCLPYMPLVIETLRKSKTWLRCRRRPELGFYLINLWMRAWHEVPAGSIEDDDDVLADAAMCSPEHWPEVKAILLEGWEARNGRIFHKTVTDLATEAATKLRGNKKRTEEARKVAEERRRASTAADATEVVTVGVTDAVTDAVTEHVTDTVTDHEGKGREYRREEDNTADAVTNRYAFEAGTIRLSQKHVDLWRQAFPLLSLESELWSLDEWAGRQGKKWFNAVSGALAKKQREAAERAMAAKAARESGGGGRRRPDPRI